MSKTVYRVSVDAFLKKIAPEDLETDFLGLDIVNKSTFRWDSKNRLVVDIQTGEATNIRIISSANLFKIDQCVPNADTSAPDVMVEPDTFELVDGNLRVKLFKHSDVQIPINSGTWIDIVTFNQTKEFWTVSEITPTLKSKKLNIKKFVEDTNLNAQFWFRVHSIVNLGEVLFTDHLLVQKVS